MTALVVRAGTGARHRRASAHADGSGREGARRHGGVRHRRAIGTRRWGRVVRVLVVMVAFGIVGRSAHADLVAAALGKLDVVRPGRVVAKADDVDPGPPTKLDDSARHRRRIIAVITGSVGAASVAVGIAHAIGASSNWHDFKSGPGEPCDSALVCNAAGQRAIDRAKGLARGADILIGSGLAVVGIAAAIWFTAPEPRIVPLVGSATGAALAGRF